MKPSFVSVIIAAGGKGSRIKGINTPKQFYRLDEKTVLFHSVRPFNESPLVNEVIIVTLEEYADLCRNELKELNKVRKIVVGGETRQQSVFNGLMSVDKDCSLVVVHDAARPFVTDNEISGVINAAVDCAAVIGTRVCETIKTVGTDGFVNSTLNRESLWAMQTPQAVPFEILTKAYAKATETGFAATDDVSLAELIGYPVKVIEGSYNNIKITSDKDLLTARAIFNESRVTALR